MRRFETEPSRGFDPGESFQRPGTVIGQIRVCQLVGFSRLSYNTLEDILSARDLRLQDLKICPFGLKKEVSL